MSACSSCRREFVKYERRCRDGGLEFCFTCRAKPKKASVTGASIDLRIPSEMAFVPEAPSVDEIVKALQACGEGRVLAKITYEKPGDGFVSERLVEPYRLTTSSENLIVDTWQHDPSIDEPAWRNFRVDRIVAIKSTTQGFKPRKNITIHTGEYTEFTFDGPPGEKPSPPTAAQRYANALNIALDDFDISTDEQQHLRILQIGLADDVIKSIHGRAYACILTEFCADGRLSQSEIDRLTSMRIWLNELGWSP